MSMHKRDVVTVDQEALAQAFMQDDGSVDQETLSRVADVMTAAAKAVLAAQGIDLRVARGRKGQVRMKSPRSKRGPDEAGEVTLAGQGLSAIVSSKDGTALLRERAVKLPLEAWAGEVMGPSKAAETLGVRRSTLDNWRTKGEIIAIPKGKAAHVIPMAQFVEGRPIAGIGRVLDIAHGSASLAWSWLTTPHRDFNAEPPIAALSKGEETAVVAAAERSIG
ncbi:hypothetical protein [Alloyangia pacifica]|uniref:antitoxin Xre/MbcA/ParS-like domain-containing protein n=1 Tax=Alloyangia pacifica TaxID=311180 RepID=UPI0031CDC1B2